MPREYLILRCPKCGNTMLYAPKDKNLKTKKKRCVYCGHTFYIYKNQRDNRIIKIIKK